MEEDYVSHYGIKGQKWGVQRFQNKDGTLTLAGKERYRQYSKNYSKAGRLARKVKTSEKDLANMFSDWKLSSIDFDGEDIAVGKKIANMFSDWKLSSIDFDGGLNPTKKRKSK